MGYRTETDDNEVKCTVDDEVLAEFSSTNRIEGDVFEADIPLLRLHSSQLLAIAKFFIDAAEQRADDEFRHLEREMIKENSK